MALKAAALQAHWTANSYVALPRVTATFLTCNLTLIELTLLKFMPSLVAVSGVRGL